MKCIFMLCFNLERTGNYFQKAYYMEQWRIQDFRKEGGGRHFFLRFFFCFLVFFFAFKREVGGGGYQNTPRAHFNCDGFAAFRRQVISLTGNFGDDDTSSNRHFDITE